MFRLKNVKYKDILEVEDLIINKREKTCIVGKSGGGKSTFLKLLNNMISPNKGKIYFKDKDINQYDPIELRREVKMLPQNPVTFSGTIRDNFIKTLLYNDLESISDQKYISLLKKVKLEKQNLDNKAEKLSGGEKQRLALARMLLLDPEILLLDEPSSSLDQETEEFIIEMVVNYIDNKNGTLIMVTHSNDIADEYGDRIMTINDGIIESIG